MCGYRRLVGCVWVSKACRVCRRLVGCVWMSKAYRVCGCQKLVGCEWVLMELQVVILCNHSISHQLNNMLICRCTCTKSYKVLHSCRDSEGLHFSRNEMITSVTTMFTMISYHF